MLQSLVKARKRIRRHRVPSPLTDGGELFEGGEILRDFNNDLAVVLWKSYKNVMLWAEAKAEERKGLFTDQAGDRRRQDLRTLEVAPELAVSLLEIADLLDRPGLVQPETVTGACRTISKWAEGQGQSATALLFMQAGALANPRDGDAACAVGRMARNRAEYARAETWFRQGIVAARETEDWPTYARSYLGLAKVFKQRGAIPAARRSILRAYRTARRHHLTELSGYAQWDFGSVAIYAGRWDEVQRHARAAVEIFGPAHPSVFRFMNDVAYAWITMGWFDPAVRVLRVVAPHPEEPATWVSVWGSLARAAGGAGESGSFDDAVRSIGELASDPAAAAGVPDAWLDVAHGAATLRRWDQAELAAQLALALATERGEARVRLDAEATLDSVRAGRHAARPASSPTPLDVPEAIEPLVAELLELAGV